MPSSNHDDDHPNSNNSHTDGSGNIHYTHTDSSLNIHDNYTDASGNTYDSYTDGSNNIHTTTSITTNSTDVSFNSTYDISYNIFTASSVIDLCNNPAVVLCVDDISMIPQMEHISTIKTQAIIDGSGYEIINTTGISADGSSNMIQTQFITTDTNSDVQITENLSQKYTTYNDETDPNSETDILLNQIKLYASEIQCSDFHGKGTIDDYTTLFQAAGRIATESKQMELNIDVEGFSEFADAADQLSDLFSGFILKLQNVNIITDLTFLRSISTALSKIVNLSNIFGKFKETIFATTTIQIPKSAHDTKVVIEGVMSEVNCAMRYINHFVDPTIDASLNGASLSMYEKNIISKAVSTIDNWNVLCDQGVSIAMSDNMDIQYITQANNELKQTTATLINATNKLKSKLASFNLTC